MKLYAALILVLCLLTPTPSNAEPPPKLTVKMRLKPAEKATAQKMVEAIKTNKELPWTLSGKQEHARIYLTFAATGDSEAIVTQGLKNLDKSWALEPEADSAALKIDRNFRDIVHARLKSKSPAVIDAAFDAVDVLIKGKTPDADTMQLLLTMTRHTSPAIRFAVQKSVEYVSITTARKNETFRQIVTAGLKDSDPAIVASTLMFVWNTRAGMFSSAQNQAPINAILDTLRAHPEPMIAIHAILITNVRRARMEATQWSAFQDELKKHLGDKRPSIRATAAMAYGIQYNNAAAPDVAALLGDKSDTKISLKGTWSELAGEPLVIETTPIGIPTRVQHAAVQALMLIAVHTPTRFSCTPPKYNDPEPGFEACLAKARTWMKGLKK